MKNVDVIFPTYINATIGPTGTLRRLLANKEYIAKRGYDLQVFTYDFLKSKGASGTVDYSKGLTFRSKVKNWIKKNALFTALFLRRKQKIAESLVKLYAKQGRNPDIVVFHEMDACYAYLKLVHSDAKKVCFFHSDGKRWEMLLKSYPALKHSLFRKVMNKQFDFILRSLDRYVFIAKVGQENFLQENPWVNRAKTVFFHNGIDDKAIVPKERKDGFKYYLCSTGTVCRRKGQYLIVEALHQLNPEVKRQIHLSLFGSGPDLTVLQERVTEYHLESQVRFYGNVPNNEIHEKLCQEDIFILMSNNEGLPISIIEAMRAGLPVISTPIAGIPEQVEPLYNGLLVEPDAGKLAEVLNNITQYDWKQMGINSRKRFEEEFSFEQMLKSYCDMLDGM